MHCWIHQSPSGLRACFFMAKCYAARDFFSLTGLQIGDLQSYLSGLGLFLAPDSKTFYVLVDNRPWLENLASRPAHLWQLMVTKSRMSPFAITKVRKGRKETPDFSELKFCHETPTPSETLRRWFLVIDAATLSRKRALLPVKKLRSSLLANSKLQRTLYGFIVFQVAWNDVRGINYSNELQTDTSLAIEAKYMRRWEFDSIGEAAKGIASWFPGTPCECSRLEEQLNSMIGDEFHDAPVDFPNLHGRDDDEKLSNVNLHMEEDEYCCTPSSSLGEQPEILEDQVSICNGLNKRRKLMNLLGMDIESDFHTEEAHSESVGRQLPSSYASDCEEADEATQYRDVLLLFRFNDRDLPFELQKIIMSDLRLLTLLEAGLPSWVIFSQSYPVFCHIYRPWMCPLARALYVVISLVTVVIGFYDLYKNVPVLKATAARLCGPLFGWIETWEMVSRIKYLGTMLFLHNFEKAVKWFLMMTRTVRSSVSVLTQPLAPPFMVVLEVLLPVWNVFIQMAEYLCSFIWILMATFWNLVENLIEIILLPVYFISSIIWMIGTAILYPILWFLLEIVYAPIRLILGLSNFVGFVFKNTYDILGGLWLFVSDIFKLASNAETSVSSYEVAMWHSLWNDLFSQIFRAVRSILNGFVAFFTACNRHRLSIYNHLQEFIRRLYQPTQRPYSLNSIHRPKKSGSKTRAESTKRRRSVLTENVKQI
ncbi:uncharacterized protein LOC112517061 isoform X2 [Cynara cardunculus var. scolymus]|uniref:uncharacterized protein LOC112517061 isoform X2 n=1 Tax=Cynara cardunculus var. scolymus TaxID=59895 RepID=UPI000D630BB7|nr:uncharacterized protein LOC112517061 isoform X2 [Cynara cardunculus var. scolymus]